MPWEASTSKNRPFTCGQRSADLVAKVHVARGVDEMQHVVAMVHSHVLGLDGDAAFAFDVHRVEILGPHEAGVDRPGQLQNAVGKRRLAVINVADDGEVPDAIGRDRTVRWGG